VTAKPNPLDPRLPAWVETWRAADLALGQIKRAELEGLDTREALRQLSDAFRDASRRPRTTMTGLVEQQRTPFRR
jgi:hypothetical protein